MTRRLVSLNGNAHIPLDHATVVVGRRVPGTASSSSGDSILNSDDFRGHHDDFRGHHH